jgi:hypothetical protein
MLDELAALSRRAAGGLAPLGLGPGERIAIWVALPEFPVTVSANGTKVQRVKLRDMVSQLLQ